LSIVNGIGVGNSKLGMGNLAQSPKYWQTKVFIIYNSSKIDRGFVRRQMLRALLCVLATGGLLVLVHVGAAQQVAVTAPAQLPAALPALSSDCNPTTAVGEGYPRPLKGVRRALRSRQSVKVLAIGSSTTVGIGASKPSATYVAKLESDLDGAFKGLDFEVVGRGKSGEEAEGQSARMKREVDEVKPDLVVWQVGTNDAIDHVDIENFKNCLRRTLAWLRDNRIDVVLVDPQYGDELARNAYYQQVVAAIVDVAREARVPLVDRFQAMKELSREHGDRFYLTSDNLHMNDTGHRCMAEQLARAIVGGILMANSEPTEPAPSQN
jgi:acyl-CoA thioesterase I